MTQFRQTLAHYDDYHQMFADKIRMSKYAEAIHRAVKPGDVVVDLGAGLGILGFLALQAGASRVHAIERGDALDLAREVAEDNGYTDRMVFHRASSMDVVLDERVDWIISETLGSFAVDENTLEFTIDARDRFLKEGGGLLPHRFTPFLAPVETPAIQARIASWQDVLGVDYSAAVREIRAQKTLGTFSPAQLLAPGQAYAELNLYEVTTYKAERTMEFEIVRDGRLHGLAGWFEVDLFEDIDITTSPEAPTTHWQQAFFPFKEALTVSQGDSLRVELRIGSTPAHTSESLVSYEYSLGAGPVMQALPPLPVVPPSLADG